MNVTGEIITGSLEVSNTFLAPYSESDVTDPPTSAELTSAFGGQSDGFIGVLDDAGGGTDVWLCVVTINGWYTIQVTAAP